MKFNRYTIKTTTEAEDIISSALIDLGIEGVQIEDKIPLSDSDKEAMFVDILPQREEDDGIAYVSFYLDAETDNSEMLDNVKKELDDIASYMEAGECSISETSLQDTDYLNNWKQYFHQFCVDDILITPSWEEVKEEDKDKMVIHIDPGTAFGTGMHETTQLCIRQLRKYVKKDTVLLDVGTGSGILSIMAYKFGAASAVGTDLDPCAIDAVWDNMEKNGLDEAGFRLIIGNIIDCKEIQDEVGYGKYDIVVANILAEVLIPLTPVIMSQLKPSGIYITSGIIEDKEQAVVDAVKAAGLEVMEVNHQGEWVSVTARKPA
ncbi:MAG: 50S ribosomal protein L11 methyltransferase [Lachnospiraceae bacterium]|nr:50S ribosomal protein L11 methyltransferase [Lachnospiraceae bacterium]